MKENILVIVVNVQKDLAKKVITARVTEEERRLITAYAKDIGKTVSMATRLGIVELARLHKARKSRKGNS